MITVQVSGATVDVVVNSATVEDTIDQRPVAGFKIIDLTGTTHYQPGQPVTITDDFTGLAGLVFGGYIDNVDEQNLYPNTTIISTLQCVGNHVHADKRYYHGAEFSNRASGDIFAEFIDKVLKYDGVKANYARDHVSSQADFNNATLSNAVATLDNGGQLEITPAGQPFNLTVGQANRFGPPGGIPVGGFGNVGVMPSGSVELNQFAAIQYTATNNVPGAGNAFLYTRVWSGSYTIGQHDAFQYDVWINKSSPSIMAAIDFVCSDGTTFRDYSNSTSLFDAQGISAHPNNDLSGLADNQWYHRLFFLTNGAGGLAGKTITSINLCFEGDSTGSYDAYFRRAYIYDWSTGPTKLLIVNDTSTALPGTPQITGNNAYILTQCQFVLAYDPYGGVVVGPVDMSSVGIYQSSMLTWDATLATDCTIAATCSVDAMMASDKKASSYLPLTSNAPLPGLTPGQSLNGLGFTCWFYMYNNGNVPTISPILNNLTWQINPAYNTTKTDSFTRFKTTAELNTGTLNNLVVGADFLKLNTQRRDYVNNINFSGDQTNFGNNNNWHFIKNRSLGLQTNGGTDVRERLDWAGSWQNFTMEFDFNLKDANIAYGAVYRTTNWGPSNDSYAYSMTMSSTSIILGRGSNSTGAGAFVSILNVPVTFALGNWHHMKIVVNGNSHQCYIDDVLYLTATDATYPNAGQIGFRMYDSNANTTTGQGFFRNFGIAQTLSGTWVSPAFSLASAGTLLTSVSRSQPNNGIAPSSQSQANGDIPQSSELVEISLDNGTTWATCPNNGVIPGLGSGVNTASITQARLRITLSITTASAYIESDGVILWLISQYNATAQRISRPIDLTPVGRIGSASINWSGTAPAGTSITLDTSLTGLSWSTAGSGASGGGPISGLQTQPAPYLDSFDANSAPGYINTASPGGAAASWNYDMANSRLIPTGGTNALYLYNLLTFTDGWILFDLDRADGVGSVLHYITSPNTKYYYTVINDASASSAPNTVTMYKYDNGALFQLRQATISFTRGTGHRFQHQMLNNILSVSMDGVTLFTFDETTHSPIPPGLAGLYSAGNTGNFYQLVIQGLGGSVAAGSNVYHRATLTTTDPTVAPVLQDITLSVRDPNIGDGALITATSYSVLQSDNTIASNNDDLAQQSDYIWGIGHDNMAYFLPRTGQYAPWIINGSDMLVASTKVSNIQDEYRNAEWVAGASDLRTLTEIKIGDTQTTSFSVGYPVDSIVSVTLNGLPVSIGPKGTTGNAFYYEVGNTAISQDSSITTLTSEDTLIIVYIGRVPITVFVRNDQEISTRQQRGGDSGVYEHRDAVGPISKAAAIQYASSRLAQYGKNGRQIEFTTIRPGLKAGQVLTTYLTPYGLIDTPMLITDVKTTWQITTDPNGVQVVQPFYDVTAVEGAIVGDWTRVYTQIGKK